MVFPVTLQSATLQTTLLRNTVICVVVDQLDLRIDELFDLKDNRVKVLALLKDTFRSER